MYLFLYLRSLRVHWVFLCPLTTSFSVYIVPCCFMSKDNSFGPHCQHHVWPSTTNVNGDPDVSSRVWGTRQWTKTNKWKYTNLIELVILPIKEGKLYVLFVLLFLNIGGDFYFIIFFLIPALNMIGKGGLYSALLNKCKSNPYVYIVLAVVLSYQCYSKSNHCSQSTKGRR